MKWNAALRYVCSNKNVTIVIPGMAEEKEIEENIKACLDDSPLSEKELEKSGSTESAWHKFLPQM